MAAMALEPFAAHALQGYRKTVYAAFKRVFRPLQENQNHFSCERTNQMLLNVFLKSVNQTRDLCFEQRYYFVWQKPVKICREPTAGNRVRATYNPTWIIFFD